MAKGQKRSSRETKKPKAVRSTPVVSGIALFRQGSATAIPVAGSPKKKG